ncbi:hypothetical protein [Rhizobium sp.]|jgi:hypothetical protein|uniref:hypothetical protein n=1 Tax=Rhizobium sp. TaxID=391 RepID=UPI000E994BF5|nr:hypothetical protein [Rhizobium sp.]
MSTADKTNKIRINGVGSCLGMRLANTYRWIASFVSRRSGFVPNNDIHALNAHQLRDLGLDGHMDQLTSQQQRLETARFNALLMLMGTNGR